MGGTPRYRKAPPAYAAIALLMVLFMAVWASPGDATGGWLQNTGFEEGLTGWNAVQPIPGDVAVVGPEGPTQFPVYSTFGVTVEPQGGQRMLRLGVPKGTDKNQSKARISVSQSFASDGRDIVFSYRIFTWEHRSQDFFTIDVKDAQGASVGKATVETGGSTSGSATPLPFQPAITLDKTVKYKDFGWRSVRVSDLPDDGRRLTLSLSLSNTVSASHDTWVYVDHRNRPPVAAFTWAPGGPPEGVEVPHEGDAVGLYGDLSYDPDIDDHIVKWEWRVNKEGQTEELYNKANAFQSPVGFIVPSDQGGYDVTLTVWDNEGSSDSVTQTVNVASAAPKVNALDVEVLAGGTARLVGRFLDSGWMDQHTAFWEPQGEGDAVQADLLEDHFATLSSGYAAGSVTDSSGPGQTEWTLSVGDADDAASNSSDPFTVSVIDADPQRFEDEETYPDFHRLPSDGTYLSFIQSAGDIDFYEVRMPDGGPVPRGTEVLVTLRDIPADYDLAVFEAAGSQAGQDGQVPPFMNSPFMSSPFMSSPFMSSPFMSSPFMSSPFMSSPFMSSPFMSSPYMHSPFMSSPFMSSPFMSSPFMSSPFMSSPFMSSPFMSSPFMSSPFMHWSADEGWGQLDGYPLSALSFTGTENDNNSGIDIAFSELGFDLEALENMRLLGFSANLGTEDEVVLATAGYPQTSSVSGHIYVAVKSTPGHFSAEVPYTLQIETSRRLDVLAVQMQPQDQVVADPSTETAVVHDQSSPLTLFVTQLERLGALYPAGTNEGDARDGGDIVRSALLSVADRVDVRGKIISLPAALYDDWDEEPWRVDLADELVRDLRSEIHDQVEPSVKYIVLVGSDRVVPFKRLLDQTIIGNEQEYAEETFLAPPSATLSSVANGYILTDDYYGDEKPIDWNGSFLYIPDRSVSRLVERPNEVARAIGAFIEADGTLVPTTAVASGYDFMADGAQAVRDTFAQAGLTVEDVGGLLMEDDWTSEQLWGFLDSGTDIGSLNAHFTHFAGLSALGYSLFMQEDPQPYDDELILSGDIAGAGGGNLFTNRLVFSMGCHAGFSSPDEQAVTADPSLSPVDLSLDFPQAMMRQGGVFLGSTGYGYGDTVGIGGTEALMGFFAKKLVGGTDTALDPPAESVGMAVAQAKQEYLGSLSTLTPYDQKSSVQFTLYGMPQYHLPSTDPMIAVRSSSPAASTTSTGLAPASEALPPFRLMLTERSVEDSWRETTVDRLYELLLHTAPDGQYVSADGRAETTPERPIHPVAPVALADRPARGPAHGFVYKAGTYSLLQPEGGFEPAISRFTVEWEVGPLEFQLATRDFWPVEPGALTTTETPTGYDQTFIAVPAQFRAEPDTTPIVGTERVWTSLEAEVLRSPPPAEGPEDWLPPTVFDVDLWMAGESAVVTVDGRDSSDISRIVVLIMGPDRMYVPPGGDASFSDPTTSAGTRNLYDVTFDLGGIDPTEAELMVQVVDGRGNVTTLTGKGDLVRIRPGLRNPGFEQGLRYWVPSEPFEGAAQVIDGDGPFPPYVGSVISPFGAPESTRMLRMGLPWDGNANQNRGVTSVRQTFVSDGSPISVAYRLLTFESRVQDIFVIDVKDSNGNTVGRFSADPDQTGPLPYGVCLELDKGEGFRDTGWVVVRVSGLAAGELFTISYTLNNDKDSAHDTWVYVDQGD